MQSANSDKEKTTQILDMWILRGIEMKRILRIACISHAKFGRMYGRSAHTIRRYTIESIVKSAWRDRVMAAVGEEFYFRELLAIREEYGTASDALRSHVMALNEKRQKRPVH